MAEITDLVDLSKWPTGTRMLVRREQPSPGAQLRFTDVDGYRYQVFVTDLPDADLAYLEALYRRKEHFQDFVLYWERMMPGSERPRQMRGPHHHAMHS